LLFYLIETWPFGNAGTCNMLVWVALNTLKLIHLAELRILPTAHVFINKYFHVTAHNSTMIFHYLKCLVKQHIDPVENIMTHSVLLILVSHIPPCFHYTDRYHPVFRLVYLWKLSRFRGHEISLDDVVRWWCYKVHQLYSSAITIPITARHIALDPIITTHPRVLSQLQLCVNMNKTWFAILSVDTETEWCQL
jgi:hypothetical protein